MKSLIRGENNPPKPKADVFAQKPVTAKPDVLEIAKGQNKDVALITTPQSVIKEIKPNLKENTFKLATKDAPFKIASVKDQDALANTNAIPIQVGPKTTLSSRSFASAKLPALQSKTFVGHSGSSGQALAMGSASSVQTPSLNSALRSNSNVGGSSKNTGKEWSSHSAAFSGDTVSALPRNTVSAFDSPLQSSKANSAMKSSDFNITGALAHRPILQKSFAAYEMDARVALRFRVDWSGRVLDGILVEISSGSPSFDQKVVAALKEWSFSRLPSNRANEIQEGVITFVFKGV
jgi:TonB family protein